MKNKDIIKQEDIPEEECDVCYLHDKAYKILENVVLCPKCNHPLESGGAGYGDFVVVGESNSYKEDQNIGKYQIYNCPKCGNDYKNIYALMPIPIKYNGNHDIFYTGGRDYVTIEENVKKNILPLIEQYTKRIREGDKQLEPWNLQVWIQYEIESIIAEFLYENGYKK